MTSVAAEFEHMEIQQQFNDGVNNRWDADDWDNENSSARLFERSRIKALAGKRDGVKPQACRVFVCVCVFTVSPPANGWCFSNTK